MGLRRSTGHFVIHIDIFFLNFKYMGTYVYAKGTAHTDKHTLIA